MESEREFKGHSARGSNDIKEWKEQEEKIAIFYYYDFKARERKKSIKIYSLM